MEVDIAVSAKVVSIKNSYSTTTLEALTLFSGPSTNMLAAMQLVQSPRLLKVNLQL